jgi:hypothetical protein
VRSLVFVQGRGKERADDIPHARDDLTAFLRARGGFETALNGLVAEPMHYHLPTARADGVDDAGALFGACHLCNEGVVSIHAYSYLWEAGRRKGREGKGGRGREEGRKNPP